MGIGSANDEAGGETTICAAPFAGHGQFAAATSKEAKYLYQSYLDIAEKVIILWFKT